MTIDRRLTAALFAPRDGASVAVFRIAFGALMLVAIARYAAYGWIDQLFIAPRVFLPYPDWEWIVPLPAAATYGLFGGLAICAAGITLGLCSRACAALFGLGFTYLHLIDRTNYLNHYYLVSLVSLLLAALPAGRVWSVDALRRRDTRTTVPGWTIAILRFQLAVVYVFGALAKVNPDWLLRAQPLRIWLGANVGLPWLGAWLEQGWVAYACSYAGLLFDASIVPVLLGRRSRPWGYGAVLAFHLLTALLFPIGMFPWLMIALTPIFFAPEWPRVALRGMTAIIGGTPSTRSPVEPAAWRAPAAVRQAATITAVGVYALLQIALPLRHLVYDGDLYWAEAGFRWSWQIMVMEKYGRATFTITDPRSGASRVAVPAEELTPLQVRMLATQPDMILGYAHHLADAAERRLGHAVEVRADAFVALNGRPHARLIDPHVDLAALPPDASPTAYVLPQRWRRTAASAPSF